MISSLHYITAHPAEAERACRAGVDWVQLRVKNVCPADWKALALDTQAICRQFGARFILNDNVALAGDIGADGVHVGNDDLPVADARRLLGPGVIIGGTANTPEHMARHWAGGASYIGLGPYRFTATKTGLSPVLGLAGYTRILAYCRSVGMPLPVVAIGGIQIADVPDLLATGVAGIAVSQAITRDPDAQVPALLAALSGIQPITAYPTTL